VRKNFSPPGIPGCWGNAGHSPLLIKGTSRREKVRKNLNPPEKLQAGREFPITALYLFKEHPEVEKGEKILVLVHFSESRPGGATTEGEERTGV
jgi:hypothetical protein